MMNGTLRKRVKSAVRIIIEPNPLNILIPNRNRRIQIKSVEICPSLIADRLLAFAVLIADL